MDTKVLIALISGISTIIGALLGGLFTYLIQTRQFKEERNRVQDQLQKQHQWDIEDRKTHREIDLDNQRRERKRSELIEFQKLVSHFIMISHERMSNLESDVINSRNKLVSELMVRTPLSLEYYELLQIMFNEYSRVIQIMDKKSKVDFENGLINELGLEKLIDAEKKLQQAIEKNIDETYKTDN